MSSHFNEKFYFRPGNTGFPVFDTPHGRIGIMICYDRHFPESARALGLGGAEYVFVPTATTTRGYSRSVWETELRAHAIANGFYVAGVNRVGVELESTYYGASVFIDPIGEIVAQGPETGRRCSSPTSLRRVSRRSVRCGRSTGTAAPTPTPRSCGPEAHRDRHHICRCL